MSMLYAHQKKIIDEDKKKCGLWLGTGSGKSRVALLLARGKTLVICPKTQALDGNWEREKQKLGLSIDLTVLSKETFKREATKLSHFDTVIIDEAHTCLGVTPNIRYRNRQPEPKTSQLFDSLKTFLTRTKPERLYLVTATPIRNPMTVWGASILLGCTFDFYQWRNTFYQRLNIPGKDIYVPKSDSSTKDHLASIVKRIGYTGRLEEFMDVPDQTHRVIYVGLKQEQKKRLKEIPLEYPDAIVQIGKKNQVENGVLSGDEFNKPESFSNEKLEKIEELAIEFPKMVIFARYTAQIEQIASLLRGMKKNVLTLTGQTKDRREVIFKAENSEECVLIVSAQISAGWELPSFRTMVFLSRTYSYVDYAQSIGRILRVNNLKKNLYIYLIVKGGICESIHKCLENKKDFDERIYTQKIK